MMLDNQQMSDFMASKGFHSDGQNVLRGMQTNTSFDKCWIAIKEEQNALLNNGAIEYRYASDAYDGKYQHYNTFVNHLPHSHCFHVWVQKKGQKKNKKWKYLGVYTFGSSIDVAHTTIKKGKLHHTNKVRIGTRVV